MFNLQSTIEKIESQVTDDESRRAFLVALKARLDERLQAQADSGLARLTKEKLGDSGESGESALQSQPLTTESEVSPSESESPSTDSNDSGDAPENAKLFAAALDKLDPDLREIAADDSFRSATQSEIRKWLFRAVRDPASDYHEIRWLLKSLQMLNEDRPTG